MLFNDRFDDMPRSRVRRLFARIRPNHPGLIFTFVSLIGVTLVLTFWSRFIHHVS